MNCNAMKNIQANRSELLPICREGCVNDPISMKASVRIETKGGMRESLFRKVDCVSDGAPYY